jgi:argininosuccinate lyase
MIQLKSEPHGDVLQAMQLPNYAATTMADAHAAIAMFRNMIEAMVPQKERMERIVRAGFSCATELAYHLIKDRGYGGRLAHSIVATMVRMAREQGKNSQQCTGELLDRAASYLGVRRPGLDTETVQKWLDPRFFIQNHRHLGGTAPEENTRLLVERRATLDAARSRQQERRERIARGLQALDSAADEILKADAG